MFAILKRFSAWQDQQENIWFTVSHRLHAGLYDPPLQIPNVQTISASCILSHLVVTLLRMHDSFTTVAKVCV